MDGGDEGGGDDELVQYSSIRYIRALSLSKNKTAATATANIYFFLLRTIEILNIILLYIFFWAAIISIWKLA